MTATPGQDLGEHISTLVVLLGMAATIAAFFFWRLIRRIEEKQDQWFDIHMACRERQDKELVKKQDFEEWKSGRGQLWHRLLHHGHRNDHVIVTGDSKE